MEVSGLDCLKAAVDGLAGEKRKPNNRGEVCFRRNIGLVPLVP